MSELLSDVEMAQWVAWKRATTGVWDAVVTDITAATGLSSADFSVLTRLVEEGGGSLRQQRLSNDLRWKRSRLSRHLTRMEQRGLIERSGSVAERLISATREGRTVVQRARVVHAESVRRNLIEAIPAADGADFWHLITHIAD